VSVSVSVAVSVSVSVSVAVAVAVAVFLRERSQIANIGCLKGRRDGFSAVFLLPCEAKHVEVSTSESESDDIRYGIVTSVA
jgi:hypothetical protein